MLQLRLWLAAAFIWLLVFYNIERLYEPFNLASFVYVLAGVLAAAVIAIPNSNSISIRTQSLGLLGLFLVLKVTLGYEVLRANIPITITEIVIIGVTLSLSHKIAEVIRQFEDSTRNLLTMQLLKPADKYGADFDVFFRELRRARQYDRPLGVLALSIDKESLVANWDQLVASIQETSARQYADASVAKILAHESSETDIVAFDDHCFIVLMPEADSERAEHLIEKLRKESAESSGLEIKAGFANFPNEEVTLSGLIEKAKSRMHDESFEMEAFSMPEPENISVPAIDHADSQMAFSNSGDAN